MSRIEKQNVHPITPKMLKHFLKCCIFIMASGLCLLRIYWRYTKDILKAYWGILKVHVY